MVKGPDGIAVIDAGEGFQTRYGKQRRRLKAHSLARRSNPRNVDVLAFTHGHLDHTWGSLPWLQSMDLENRQQPLILGPTSSTALTALLEGTAMPEDIPPADLARQWLAWYALGGSGLRFPVRWVLGVVGEGRWAEVDPHTGTATLLDGMPQPEGWSNSTLTPLPTTHTVPSCGWMIQQHAKAGSLTASVRMTSGSRPKNGPCSPGEKT